MGKRSHRGIPIDYRKEAAQERARKRWKDHWYRQANLLWCQDAFNQSEWDRIVEMIYSEDDSNTTMAIQIIIQLGKNLKIEIHGEEN